jgi:hypothetical protein
MSGTRPLVEETGRLRPGQPEPVGKPWREGLRQFALVLTRSGSGSREDTMTVFQVAGSIEPFLRLPEEQA